MDKCTVYVLTCSKSQLCRIQDKYPNNNYNHTERVFSILLKIGDAGGNNHSANADISASDNFVDVGGNELITNETPQDSHGLNKRDDSTAIIEKTVPI